MNYSSGQRKQRNYHIVKDFVRVTLPKIFASWVKLNQGYYALQMNLEIFRLILAFSQSNPTPQKIIVKKKQMKIFLLSFSGYLSLRSKDFMIFQITKISQFL